MLTFFLSVAVIWNVLVNTVSAQCPSGWSQHASLCYFFSREKASWVDAEGFCKAFSSKLAEPRTASAANFITGKAQQLHTEYWIGITDVIVEGEWIYASDLSPITVKYWGGSEPNNLDAANCVATYLPVNSRWADDSCSGQLSFVCERETSSSGEILG